MQLHFKCCLHKKGNMKFWIHVKSVNTRSSRIYPLWFNAGATRANECGSSNSPPQSPALSKWTFQVKEFLPYIIKTLRKEK